jgi:hypothetical protein
MKNLTTTASNEDYGNELDRMAAYIGMAPLSTTQKLILIDFLKSEFRTIQPSELIDAVKGVMSGRIEPTKDVTKIQRMSTGWFGAILNAYKKKRQELNARPEPVRMDRPQIETFTGIDGKEKGYYEGLKKWYLENGGLPPYGWAYAHARKYVQDRGELLVKKEDQNKVNKLASDYVKSLPAIYKAGKVVRRKVEQIHLDRAVMQLHLARLTEIK